MDNDEAGQTAGRRLPLEHLSFGFGLGSLLAAAALAAAAPLALVAASLVIGEGLGGLGRPFWREWALAALAAGAALAALLHSRTDGLREATPQYPATYPRPRAAVLTGLLAIAAAGIGGYRLIRPPGPAGDSMLLFHGAGVPSRPVVSAALLAAAGCAALVFWSLRRSRRFEREWEAAGAPQRRAEWRPIRLPRRAAAALLGAGMAVLLVPAGSPLSGVLTGQAVERSRGHTVNAETFSSPQAASAVPAGDESEQAWSRPDLRQAIPAGDLVIGLEVPDQPEGDNPSTVWGLRAADGAQLWRWSIGSRILDVVVDPVEGAVLVLLYSAVVVLDFTGDVTAIDTLPPAGERRLWYAVEQQPEEVVFDQPPHPPGLARMAVLENYDGISATELLGVEVATGAVRWRAEVPPQCKVSAVVVPDSWQQPVGTDVLVGFGGSRLCRTDEHVTRFGPDGPRWSASVAPAGAVLRSCFCSELWPVAPGPELVTVLLTRRVEQRNSESELEVELVVLDAGGHQQAVLPLDRVTRHSYLLQDAQAGAGGPMIAVADTDRWRVFDPAGDQPQSPASLPAPDLNTLDPPVTAWPLVVEHRDDDVLRVWDASAGMQPVGEITLPAGAGCYSGNGRLSAYGGLATLVCFDGRPRATVVALPAG